MSTLALESPPLKPAPALLDRLLTAVLPDSLLKMDAPDVIRQIITERWSRLAFEFEDPLDLLYSKSGCQWTAGWQPSTPDNPVGSVFLLMWETVSWETPPIWTLYIDGMQVYQGEDELSNPVASLCRQILDGEKFPQLTYGQFFQRVQDFTAPSSHRAEAADRILKTLLVRPEIISALKEPLFLLLEAPLPTQTLPDLLKIHHLEAKNQVVRLFRALVEQDKLPLKEDRQRLHGALVKLQTEYQQLKPTLLDLFKPRLELALQQFRKEITQGMWRIRLFMDSMQKSSFA